eukprot:TRINITY_DN753_c0_g1_i1.p1 TRINITY_DN753_c0_g1~~TRINITY_DN753_c0_g1_i1.p1  ORF type:complete len:242 (-),score=50.57 TRINITY_DN753_c0_g1_i1:365-1090(-)
MGDIRLEVNERSIDELLQHCEVMNEQARTLCINMDRHIQRANYIVGRRDYMGTESKSEVTTDVHISQHQLAVSLSKRIPNVINNILESREILQSSTNVLHKDSVFTGNRDVPVKDKFDDDMAVRLKILKNKIVSQRERLRIEYNRLKYVKAPESYKRNSAYIKNKLDNSVEEQIKTLEELLPRMRSRKQKQLERIQKLENLKRELTIIQDGLTDTLEDSVRKINNPERYLVMTYIENHITL